MRRTLVENSRGADRRRNVFDIVADLGFLDRKPQPRLGPPPDAPVATPPSQAVVTAPPALTLVKPQPQDEDLVQTLTEAQQRAAEQRMAAERLLREAIELEERLADEAAHARAASEQALARELAATLDDLRAAERTATEHAEVCSKNFELIAEQRTQAETRQAGDRAALAEARRRLEAAEAACSESALRFNDASAAEKTARAEASAAAEAMAARRTAREDVQERLRGVQERAAAIPADPATRISERRAADAAKRIAERHAADAQRGAVS
jgi:hypothetical protein